ncbi:MAG: DUF2231 domain-containing protein [Idiomarina sp.]|nr:DUF2231 domain-containing protein [Idiomarina sp.]
MIEIIPNMHPIYVKFSVALVFLSCILYGALQLSSRVQQREELVRIQPWLYGTAVLAVLLTLVTGIWAYFTVPHDGPSHVAMAVHRDWALYLSVVFITAVVLWLRLPQFAEERQRLARAVCHGLMLASFILLLLASWHGAELVYRYGLGVQSLPEVTGEGHDHHH